MIYVKPRRWRKPRTLQIDLDNLADRAAVEKILHDQGWSPATDTSQRPTTRLTVRRRPT